MLRRARAPGPPCRADRLRPAHAGDDRHRVPRRRPGRTRPTPSSCCSPPTPTPTSPSRRSTTSGSTTTCSSRGTRPRSACTPSSTTCSSDWRDEHLDDAEGVRVVGPPLVGAEPRAQDVPGPQPRAVPLARPRARRRGRAGSRSWPARARRTCPSCSCPTASRCARRRPPISPTRSACARARSSRCTTSASSAAGRPAWRPPCTARRRGSQTVVIEREAPGGQAGQSAAIENYLGFPKGLSGADLTHRAVAQARRFGAEMVLARDVVGFEARGPVRAVRLADGTEIEARTVLVATGVSYRLLEATGPRRAHRSGRVLRRRRQRGAAPARATTSTSSAPRTRPARPR